MRALLLTLLLATSSALAADVQLKTSDGHTLSAYESGRGTTGVLLVHDAGRTRADWGLIRPRLEDRGFRILALDLRGHGDSTELLEATEPDWEGMIHDVRAGFERLKRQGAKEITIVGAGLGANLALQLASEIDSITSLVLLSPGLNVKGYRPSRIVADIGEHPVLLAASEQDRMAANTLRYLDQQLKGTRRSVVLPGTYSGARMLDENPSLEDQLLSWLNGNYDLGDADQPAGSLKLREVEASETGGKRFGE